MLLFFYYWFLKNMNYYIEVLKKYAVFSGRARRKEFWMFCLFNLLIAFAISFVATLISSPSVGNLLGMFYSLVILLPGLAVSARRLHDTGKSAWWLLVFLIPFVGLIIFVVLMVADSTPGVNKYGPNPKESSPSVPPAPAAL